MDLLCISGCEPFRSYMFFFYYIFLQMELRLLSRTINYKCFDEMYFGKLFKILLFSLFIHYSPYCFLLFVDYHWFLFILFEILKINTWWGVLVRLKQYIYSVYIAMKLSSLEVVGFWLTGVTASLITHRQISAYYTHHKHPHNFLPSHSEQFCAY